MTSLREWIKPYKKEIVSISCISAASIIGLLLFLAFRDNEAASSVMQSHREESEHSSSVSEPSIPPDDGGSSPKVKVGHRSANKKEPLPLNESYEEWKTKRNGQNPQNSPSFPDITLPLSPNNTTGAKPDQKNDSTLTPRTPKGSDEMIESRVSISENSIDFKSALENFRNKMGTGPFIAPVYDVTRARMMAKSNSAADFKAHLANLFVMNHCFNTTQSTPFDLAHKKVVDLLIDNIIEGKCTSANSRTLEEAFRAAKQEAHSPPKSLRLRQVYASGSLKDFISEMVNFSKMFEFISWKFLELETTPEFNNHLETLFYSCRLLEIFGQGQDWASSVNFRRDYASQSANFESDFFASNYFYEAYVNLLSTEFLKPTEDSGKIHSIIQKWRSLKAVPSETASLNSTEVTVTVDCAVDLLSARKAIHQYLLNDFLYDYMQTGRVDPNLKQLYVLMRQRAGTIALERWATLDDFINNYRARPVLPTAQAVLSGPPNRGNLSFMSAILQSLANFLPLFQSSEGYGQMGGHFATLLKEVSTKLGREKIDSTGSGSDFSDVIRNPIQIFYKFLHDFPNNGFFLWDVCGLIKSPIDYPPYLGNIDLNVLESVEKVEMLGQLYIYSFGNLRNATEIDPPRDIPTHLNMRIYGLKERKRFDLYSIIFVQNNTRIGVSYVRRANDRWYNTIQTDKPFELPVSSIPLKKSQQQATNHLPLMAFYLRTE